MKKIIFLMITVILLAGCSSTPTKIRGESLSSALTKSQNENEEERKVKDRNTRNPNAPVYNEREYERTETRRVEVASYGGNPQNTETTAYSRAEYNGIYYGQTWSDIKSSNISSLDTGIAKVNLLVKPGAGPEYYLDLYIKAGTFNWNKNSPYADSMKNKNYFSFGGKIAGKIFGDPSGIMGVGIAGVGGAYYNWEYKNPLIDSYGKITNDGFGSMEISCGLGIRAKMLSFIIVNAEVLPTLYLGNEFTNEEFKNDIHRDGVGIEYRVEAGFGI